MPTALSDPSPTLYAFLVILVLVLAGVWYRKQKTGNLIRLIAAVVAILTVFLIDRFVESPREEASRKVQEMAKASQEKNWNGILEHISDSFVYKGPFGSKIDKKEFASKLKQTEAIPEFKGFVILDMHRADYRIIDASNSQLGFGAKLKEYPDMWWIMATFIKDPDGQWRMSGFNRYDAVKTDQRSPPLPIPGLDQGG